MNEILEKHTIKDFIFNLFICGLACVIMLIILLYAQPIAILSWISGLGVGLITSANLIALLMKYEQKQKAEADLEND